MEIQSPLLTTPLLLFTPKGRGTQSKDTLRGELLVGEQRGQTSLPTPGHTQSSSLAQMGEGKGRASPWVAPSTLKQLELAERQLEKLLDDRPPADGAKISRVGKEIGAQGICSVQGPQSWETLVFSTLKFCKNLILATDAWRELGLTNLCFQHIQHIWRFSCIESKTSSCIFQNLFFFSSIVIGPVFVFICCITIYHKFSGLKQPPLTNSQRLPNPADILILAPRSAWIPCLRARSPPPIFKPAKTGWNFLLLLISNFLHL